MAKKSFRWAMGLFLVTCLSTWYVGDHRYGNGFGYMVPVMLILLRTRWGIMSPHFSIGHRLPPFFIPAPFTPLGTFGAVIVKQAGAREDRKTLFDIAIAGPLAGLVIAIPVCIYGAMTATAVPSNRPPNRNITSSPHPSSAGSCNWCGVSGPPGMCWKVPCWTPVGSASLSPP
ncbi:MAG: hypothetical protein R3C12_09200 [Planctomycetaceae bacterium]